MKIENITPLPQAEAAQANKAQSTREKAMAAFMGNKQPEQAIVQDQTHVGVEELGALKTDSTDLVDKQDDTVETQTTEEEATPKSTEPPLSSQYAQLARKEKALRAQAQSMKAREAEIAKREAALAPAPKAEIDIEKYVSKEELKANAWKTLQDLGVTGDQLAEQQLYAPSQETVSLQNELRALRAELNAVKGGYEETKKNIEEQQTSAYKQTVATISREVDRLVATDSTYETIAATKSGGQVVKLIEKTFAEDGIVLDIEEAAQMVEDHLAEKYTKIASIKKIQQRMQAAQAANASKNTAQKQNQDSSQQANKKTLTNNMSGNKPLSSRDRAILAFNNKLTK